MENKITLTAGSKETLNKLIDDRLKQDYLLSGGIYNAEDGTLNQIMTLPNNIDEEFTLAGGVRLIIMLVIMSTVLYFAL